MTEYSGLVMKPEYLFYREASLQRSTDATTHEHRRLTVLMRSCVLQCYDLLIHVIKMGGGNL